MLKIKNNNLLIKSYLNKGKYETLAKYLITLKNTANQCLIIYLTKNIGNKLSLIKFILLIASFKKNIFFHILDSIGNELLFYSIGSVGLNKNYNQKLEVLKIYLKKITVSFNKLKNKTITAHILNINNDLSWFFNKLADIMVLVNINLLYKLSYNGCRKKKR